MGLASAQVGFGRTVLLPPCPTELIIDTLLEDAPLREVL